MSELPPDPPRLRAILAHLDHQLAETETIGTYLRLQRAAVQAALASAEAPAARRPGRLPKGGAQVRSMGMAQANPRPQFIVQQRRTPRGPEPSIIHIADCSMIDGIPHTISEHDARVSLTDPTIEPCAFCRPDTELGIDVA
ncbi:MULTISPECIES: DUF6233 domain-containing protein [unclassified Streptomyces]|uniref:DUF6233 domain-containing protein n=1 Tax=unclassified Streptomyces TaxID=2593676 RepID=UPI00190DC9F0|nr:MULTISPECIES: DUF6233 domain-containing protein [unclassified Streptomyces]MBK3563203.1 hypothetical protein [Streptomyces sp. MBT62]MBK6013192.1 hypothetical protein [Streptomyces sp. MBT53]